MIREILLIHHTHTDIGYTHDQPIVWELNRQYLDDALDEIERTQDWDAASRPIWTAEVTQTLRHWVAAATPRDLERFRLAVAAGRLSGCAMPYNFTPMPGTAEFLRALAALPELRQTLGLPFKVALNHDINGLPWTMVPLLLDAGVEMVMMGINVYFGGYPLHRPMFFKWVGPDGRGLLAVNGEHYGNFQRYARLLENSLEATAAGLTAYTRRLEAENYPHDFAYLSLTHFSFWDNNPPYPAAFEMIRRWNAQGRTPLIRFVTPEDLLARIKTLDLPAYAGDWTDYWNFGTASSAHETRVAHGARAALAGADLLSLQRAPARDKGLPQVMREAYDALALWDEHTWGHYASVSDPDRDAVVAAWHIKAQPAYRANALARYALAEQLEALAGNPRHAAHTEGVLIANPTPFARTDYLRLLGGLAEGAYDHLSSTAHRVAEAAVNDEAINIEGQPDPAWHSALFGPFQVPAYGALRLPLAALTLREADGLNAEPGRLQSPTHRLAYDPANGAIRSLVDRRSGREYADTASEWPLFSLVHEAVDGPVDSVLKGREVMVFVDYDQAPETGFLPGWKARRTLEQTVAVQTVCEPHRVGLEVRATLPGASEITKRIWLYAHTDAIGIDLSLRKADVWTPESIYLALPLDLPGWAAVYDTMGTPTGLDREQLDGVCRDWVTVSGYLDVHTPQAGLTLACPDMPIVSVGGFNFGQRQRALNHTGKPLLLAWLLNNYWSTNFRVSQPGFLRYHYELSTHAGFDPVAAARLAAFARGPLNAHPSVTAARPETITLAAVEGDDLIITAVQRQADGACVWLQNLSSEPRRATLRLPQTRIRSAARCDTLGQPGAALPVSEGALSLDVPARGVAGVYVHY